VSILIALSASMLNPLKASCLAFKLGGDDARALRWEVKRPQRAKELASTSNDFWLERANRLTQVREVTQAEIDALPGDTAYAWEILNGQSYLPPWNSVNNFTPLS